MVKASVAFAVAVAFAAASASFHMVKVAPVVDSVERLSGLDNRSRETMLQPSFSS